MDLRNGWLLATGTLTAVRVPPPTHVDREVAGTAMVLAPLAVLPLGAVAAGVALVGGLVGLPALSVAVLVLLALALGTRALHWDGLADTADGLTASYLPERSLEVMRTGPVGPAGVVAVVLVAGLQASALAAVLREDRGWWVAGALVCLSRVALPLACVRGVPAARADGLGAVHIGAVPVVGAAGVLLAAALVLAVVGPPTLLVGLALLLLVLAALLVRCVRRLGGITGDVLGAAVETSFAVLLLAAVAVA